MCLYRQRRQRYVGAKDSWSQQSSTAGCACVYLHTHTYSYTREYTHKHFNSRSSLLHCSVMSSMPSVLVVTVCQRTFCEYFTIRYTCPSCLFLFAVFRAFLLLEQSINSYFCPLPPYCQHLLLPYIYRQRLLLPYHLLLTLRPSHQLKTYYLLIHTSATGFTDISALVWFQHVSLFSSESRYKDKSIVPKSGCVFKVRNGPTGESKNIYIGCPTKNAVTLTRTSILESASYYLKNCKSIGTTKNEERIISTVCAQIVSENLIMRSIL